jgi:Helix-turn-helix domain of resolvase
MAAMAKRTFAAVILKGAPPFRPRARAEASPALVRSEIRSRSNSAYCSSPQYAELERSLITERTKAGVAAARPRGVKFGRKPKLTRQQISQARKLIAQGERPADVAESFHVGRTTLYRALAA